MVVAVERGLASIKEKLERHGYKAVYADEYRYPPDAYIYTGRRAELPALSAASETRGAFYGSAVSHGNRGTAGIVEINAFDKSFEEIMAALSVGRRGNYFY